MRDGAEWIQGFVDCHWPDAVRILDFPYALGSVAQAGQAVYGAGTAAFTQWFIRQRQALPHGDPEEVLRALRQLAATAKRHRREQAATSVQTSLSYLAKRRGLLDYAWYQARGYPIGSGRVESANKLVVERRRKGAGMHWARAQVNPMVALHTVACSDRWAEAWPHIVQQVRQHTWQCRVRRRRSRPQLPAALSHQPAQPAAPLSPAPAVGESRRTPVPEPTRPTPSKGPYCPPPDHPWRRFRIGRVRAQPPVAVCVAKL